MFKEHQKDINNKVSSSVSKINKKISLVEANMASKHDQMHTKLKEMIDANQKII